MKRTRNHLFLSLVILALSLLVPVASASAATTGHIGSVLEGGTLCYGNTSRIIVRPPYIGSSAILDWSKVTTVYGGGGFGGGFHTQRVSYQAFLYRWNGYAWAYTGRPGPLYSGWAYDSRQSIVWNNMDMGGSTVFHNPGPGYFRVRLIVTWHADALTPGGVWDVFGTQYEYLNGSADWWCQYT
jgi:hypothetical protein